MARSFQLTSMKTTEESLHLTQLEEFIVIWFDQSLNNDQFNGYNQEVKLFLRAIDLRTLLFSNPIDCFEYVKSVSNEKILLIISGSYAKIYLDQLHGFHQIESVFIFCLNLETYLPLKEFYSKVENIINRSEQLFESLTRKYQPIKSSTKLFSLFSSELFLTQCLNGASLSYIWFKLMEQAFNKLNSIEMSQNRYEELILFCQSYYHTNSIELQNILTFQETYVGS